MSEMTQQPVVRLKDGAVRGQAGLRRLRVPRHPLRGALRSAPEPDAAAAARPGVGTGERDATAYGPTVPKGDYPPARTLSLFS